MYSPRKEFVNNTKTSAMELSVYRVYREMLNAMTTMASNRPDELAFVKKRICETGVSHLTEDKMENVQKKRTPIDPTKRTRHDVGLWKAPLPNRDHIVRIVEPDGAVLRQTLLSLEMYVERTMNQERDTIQRVSLYGHNLNTTIEVVRVSVGREGGVWAGWALGADWFREEIGRCGIATAAGIFFLNDLDNFVDVLERIIPAHVIETYYQAEFGDAVEIDGMSELPVLPEPEVSCEAWSAENVRRASEA